MFTPQMLAVAIQNIVAECEHDQAWLVHLMPAVLELPAGDYRLVDPETDYDLIATVVPDVEAWQAALPGGDAQLAEWGMGDNMGYGDLRSCSTPSGPGLVMSFGGSPGNSAFTVWVLPAAELPAGYPHELDEMVG